VSASALDGAFCVRPAMQASAHESCSRVLRRSKTFLLLARAFRSLIIPIKAVLNLLSVGAVWELMVLVWQHGWDSYTIWGIEATHAINVEMPIVVFAFLFRNVRSRPKRRDLSGRPGPLAVISARLSPWSALAAAPTPSTREAPSDAPGAAVSA
jgi:hypothetical protein